MRILYERTRPGLYQVVLRCPMGPGEPEHRELIGTVERIASISGPGGNFWLFRAREDSSRRGELQFEEETLSDMKATISCWMYDAVMKSWGLEEER